MKRKSPHSSLSEKKKNYYETDFLSSRVASHRTSYLAIRVYTTSRNAFHLPPPPPPPRDLLGPIERTIGGHIGVVGLPSWPRTTDPLNDHRLDDDETTNPTSRSLIKFPSKFRSKAYP